jgi:hypothetical protein
MRGVEAVGWPRFSIPAPGGEGTVSEANRTLKQRVIHGVKEYLAISAYLFVIFSLLVLYKSVILAEHHIDFTLDGLALINALALAKIILLAQDLKLGERFRESPLIYSTVFKSFVFSILLACFKIAEEAAMGWFHGKSFSESIFLIGGGSWEGILSLSVLMFFVLVPFFAFTELHRVLGEDTLRAAFFRSRSPLNLPPAGS